MMQQPPPECEAPTAADKKRLELHAQLESLGVTVAMPTHDLVEYDIVGVSEEDLPAVHAIIKELLFS